MDDRIIDSNLTIEDVFDKNIRPESLDEYVGQKKIKENLHVFIEAAKMRNEPLDLEKQLLLILLPMSLEAILKQQLVHQLKKVVI